MTAAPGTICPRCKRDHATNPILRVGDPATSLKYGDGHVTSLGRNGYGCASAYVTATSRTHDWRGDGEWRLKADPLPTDLRDRPTSLLLSMLFRLLESQKPLQFRAATPAERDAFWALLKAEIDVRIPRRGFDASDEPIDPPDDDPANADSHP